MINVKEIKYTYFIIVLETSVAEFFSLKLNMNVIIVYIP